MKNLKPYIKIAIVVLIVLFLVNKVPQLRKIVYGG